MKYRPARLVSLLLSACVLGLVLPLSALHADQVTSSSTRGSDKIQKVYKTVGPDGQVIYSDKPSPGSEEITVPLSGGYKPVPTPRGFTPYQPPAPKKNKATNKVSITQPEDKATIRSAEGILSVSVGLTHALQQNQALVYQVDGKTLYSGSATSHTFHNIYRGTHTVTVQLTDANGNPVSSASATVYMKRPFKKK